MVTSSNFFYSWNPQPYALTGGGTGLTPSLFANPVQMTATACPGWRFDHWEYKNAAGQWVTAGTTSTKTVYMNWWTGTGIHVPNGQETFYLVYVNALHENLNSVREQMLAKA